MSFSKIVLMAVGLSGTLAQATEYTYKDPVFRVVNPAGSVSNNIVDCAFTKTVGGETVDSSWGEFSAATDGTLVKEGTGWITIDRDLSKFMGEIHAAAGVLHIHHDLGLGNFLGGAGYAHAGATMYMHQRADGKILPNSEPYDSHCTKALFIEGTGAEEIGAALWAVSEAGDMNWPLMRYLTLTGDATVRVGNAKSSAVYLNWRPASEVRLNGHHLTLVDGPGTTRPQFRLNNMPMTAGRVTADGVKISLTTGATLEGDAANTLTITNGGALNLKQCRSIIDWTLDYTASAYALTVDPQNENGHAYEVGATNVAAWRGPVRLGTDLRLYNDSPLEPRVTGDSVLSNAHHVGVNLLGPVSGDYGIMSFPGAKERYRSDMLLGLANPANTFTGGVALGEGCALALYANGALPAAGGAASLTNGAVYIAADETFALPDLDIAGTGLVQQVMSVAGGRWRTVTKTGPGDLVWHSCLTADCFDIREGRLVLASADNLDWSHFAGLTVWTNYYNTGVDKNTGVDRSANYKNGVVLPTGVITLQPDAAYNATGWKIGASSTYTFYSYRGYLWNPSPTTETWSAAMQMDKGGRFYLDEQLILEQTVRNEGQTTNFVITPGPHAFEFRYFSTSGNSGATGMGYGETVFKYIDDEYFPLNAAGKHDNPAYGEKGGKWQDNWGFVVDRLGRRTHNCDDYEKFVDPGDGSVFTRSTNIADVAALSIPASLTTIKFGPQAALDLNGWNCVSAETLEGLPTIEHGDFTVTGKWKFSGADVAAGGRLTTAGAFTLGPEATVEVTDFALFPRENVTVIQAAGGFTIPASQIGKRLDVKGHFRLRQTSDTTLSLEYSAGTTLVFR